MPRICFESWANLGERRELSIQLPEIYDDDHMTLILEAFNINPRLLDDFYISYNGHILHHNHVLNPEYVYRLLPRLRGGKGGFGSMLRAIGAQIEKTTSREACRDLSGRRMRDVNNEKKLKDWMAGQADRDKEKAERKRERRERQKAMPNHKFEDRTYDQQKSTVKENLEDALQAGLTKLGSTDGSRKRKSDDVSRDDNKRRAAEWLGVDVDDMSDLDSSDSDTSVCASPFPLIADHMDDHADSPAESNVSTAVQFSDKGSDYEWDNMDQIEPAQDFEPVHSDELLSQIGECSKSDAGSALSECGECSKSDAGSVRSERGECSKSDAGSVRSERGECSKSDAGSVRSERECGRLDDAGSSISELSNRDSTRSHQTTSSNEIHNSDLDKGMDTTKDEEPFTLEDFHSAAELHVLGLEKLKSELMARGLKCGGTIEQRSERLFSVKGLRPDQYNPSIVSKGGKSKSSQR